MPKIHQRGQQARLLEPSRQLAAELGIAAIVVIHDFAVVRLLAHSLDAGTTRSAA